VEFLGCDFTWNSPEFGKLVLMLICLLAFETEVKGIALGKVGSARATIESCARMINKTFTTRVAKHVSFSNELLAVLGWLVSVGNLLPVEFMKVVPILLVATLAEAKIIAGVAIKPEFSSFNGLLATIASKPALKLLSSFLVFKLLLHLFL
jgi:hypothetical protein